jgi:hypothetical protein
VSEWIDVIVEMLRHEERLKLAFIENTAVLLGSVYRINSGRRCL